MSMIKIPRISGSLGSVYSSKSPIATASCQDGDFSVDLSETFFLGMNKGGYFPPISETLKISRNCVSACGLTQLGPAG